MNKVIAAVICAVGITGVTKAIDVGDPIYKSDVQGDMRVEFIYESYDRDAELNIHNFAVERPGESITTSREVNETAGADTDLYMARLSWLLSEKMAVYVDAGIDDEDDAEDTPLIFGIGGRLMVMNKSDLQLSVFGNAHYVPPFDLAEDSLDDELGRVEASGEEEFYEFAAGVLLSGKIALDKGTTLVPYGGLLFSIVRGDLDASFSYPDSSVVVSANTDIEEDDPLVGVVGASLLFRNKYSLRVEGRLIGDSSVSVALGSAF